MGQAQQADDLVMMFADAAWRRRLRLALQGGARRFGQGRFLHRLSDGWSASLHLRHAGREQGDDLMMMFTGPAGKRKI